MTDLPSDNGEEFVLLYFITTNKSEICFISRAHTPKNEVFSSQYLMLPAERACSN